MGKPVFVRLQSIELATVSFRDLLRRLLLQLSDLVGGNEEQRDIEEHLQDHYHVYVEEHDQLIVCKAEIRTVKFLKTSLILR